MTSPFFRPAVTSHVRFPKSLVETSSSARGGFRPPVASATPRHSLPGWLHCLFPSSVSSASWDPGPPFFALPCVPKQKNLPGCSVQWGWARVLCLRAEPQPSTQQLPAITQTCLLSFCLLLALSCSWLTPYHLYPGFGPPNIASLNQIVDAS